MYVANLAAGLYTVMLHTTRLTVFCFFLRLEWPAVF